LHMALNLVSSHHSIFKNVFAISCGEKYRTNYSVINFLTNLNAFLYPAPILDMTSPVWTQCVHLELTSTGQNFDS